MGHKGPLPPLPLFITPEQTEAVWGGNPHGPGSSVQASAEEALSLGIPLASVRLVLLWNDRVEVVRLRRDHMGQAIWAGRALATETTVIPVIAAEAINLDNQRPAAMGV